MRYLLLLFLILCSSPEALAKKRHPSDTFNFTKSEKYASIIVDYDNGKILHSVNAKRPLHPASLTKMMTIYITFHYLKNGNLYINDQLPVSYKAASQPRTNMALRTGQKLSVKDALYSLIIHSANDVAVVLAEALAGSEESFVHEMNTFASKIGMKDTNFANASGWHDDEQVTTAYDMAKLGIALKRDFPEYFKMFSQKSFSFSGRVINSHNRVLKMYKYADGLKTGYTRPSGFNLVTTTNSPKGALVAVVMGMHTAPARDKHMVELLEAAYHEKLPQYKYKQQYQAVYEETPKAETHQSDVYAVLEGQAKQSVATKKIAQVANNKKVVKNYAKATQAAKVKPKSNQATSKINLPKVKATKIKPKSKTKAG